MSRQLSNRQVRQIRSLAEEGLRIGDIAVSLGLLPKAVEHALKGRDSSYRFVRPAPPTREPRLASSESVTPITPKEIDPVMTEEEVEAVNPSGPGRRARAAARREKLYGWLVSGNLSDAPVPVESISELYHELFPSEHLVDLSVKLDLSQMVRAKYLSAGKLYPHLYRPHYGQYAISKGVRLDDYFSKEIIGFDPLTAEQRTQGAAPAISTPVVPAKPKPELKVVPEPKPAPEPVPAAAPNAGALSLRPFGELEGETLYLADDGRIVKIVIVGKLS